MFFKVELNHVFKEFQILISMSVFGRVQDVYYSDNRSGLIDFVKTVVLGDSGNGWGRMLPDLSDVYVWIESGQSGKVLGFMEIKKREAPKGYSFIEYIDTLVPGQNIASQMMTQYELMTDKCPIPYEILWSSRLYWKRYLEDIDANIDDWKDKVEWRALTDPLL
jgi:hypothetical protein